LVLAVQGHQMPMAQMALILFLVLSLLRAVVVVVALLQTLVLVAGQVVAATEIPLALVLLDKVLLVAQAVLLPENTAVVEAVVLVP
jgi:hypothetical protein